MATSTFKAFTSDDIVAANPSEVTMGLWPGDTGSLTAIYTGSQALTSSESSRYYWDAYDINPTGSFAQVCFAVAYGHRLGGGSPTLLQNDLSTIATEAVYSQYRNLLLDPGDTQFTFFGSYNSNHIYVINIYRALIKERLDPGNWELTLSGPNGLRTFIDDSGQSLGAAFGKSGQVFNIVSGSLSGSAGSTLAASGSLSQGGFGLFYPSLGVMVFNPDALRETLGWTSGSYYTSGSGEWYPVTGSVTVDQFNHGALFNSINAGGDFQARSAENISSTHYFVRLAAAEFNYSNNPTYFDATNGSLVWTAFIQDPKTYVTTIGLYNDNNELLAVAKVSQPIQKAFDKEINLRVRLDF